MNDYCYEVELMLARNRVAITIILSGSRAKTEIHDMAARAKFDIALKHRRALREIGQ
jgi:hypothetical protein